MELGDLDSVHAIEQVVHRAPWTRDILRDCILVDYDCRVIEADLPLRPVIAGYIISRYDENACHILNISVASELQHTGYGQLLLQAIFDSLVNTEIKSIFLEVRPSNVWARHLYEKMDFQQIGVKRGYYRVDQTIEDALVLEKKL